MLSRICSTGLGSAGQRTKDTLGATGFEPALGGPTQGAHARQSIEIARVNWFSTYHVHHRVADHFRKDRAFLLGDAAHIHSPVGGQGMNTGIGDAVNLAWKLAWVLKRRADKSLLDSYELERITFARCPAAGQDDRSGLHRRDQQRTDRPIPAPRCCAGLAPVAVRIQAVAAGRLPHGLADQRELSRQPFERGSSWLRSRRRPTGVRTSDIDNYVPLTALDWQVHVYGEATDDLRRLCAARSLKLQGFPWRTEMARSGLRPHAAYFVRPDGYVAIVETDAKGGHIAAYLHARHIAPMSDL
jgi:hypothetical protein